MQLWAQAIIMYKDALENIPKLAKKYELGIISNTHDSDLVPSILSRYDLKKYFQQVVLSVNEKFRKPSIKIFQAATGEQYYANEWCFVGDNFEQDIQGAKAANIYPILILRKSSTISTDNCTIIHTLDEIHNVLKTGG
jgi:HAD superfamily hydrolase (TIGR01549 family)